MIEIVGHFDGRVIVPDEPVELPIGRRLILNIQTLADPPIESIGVPGKRLIHLAGTIPTDDLKAMSEAIH
jgi:hypothetical protein